MILEKYVPGILTSTILVVLFLLISPLLLVLTDGSSLPCSFWYPLYRSFPFFDNKQVSKIMTKISDWHFFLKILCRSSCSFFHLLSVRYYSSSSPSYIHFNDTDVYSLEFYINWKCIHLSSFYNRLLLDNLAVEMICKPSRYEKSIIEIRKLQNTNFQFFSFVIKLSDKFF